MINARDFIDFKMLSLAITGKPESISRKFIKKDYKKQVDKLLKSIQRVLDNQINQ